MIDPAAVLSAETTPEQFADMIYDLQKQVPSHTTL